MKEVGAVTIGKLIEAHYEKDEQKFKAYAEFIAEAYKEKGGERAERIIRSKIDGSYKNKPIVVSLDNEVEKTKDEETARDYALVRQKSLHLSQRDTNLIQLACLHGLKIGRPQWHDLREDPTDIPPRKDDTYSVEVWAKNARGNYGTAVFSYACFKDDGKYNHWSGVVPVLWTELPTFDKETEK